MIAVPHPTLRIPRIFAEFALTESPSTAAARIREQLRTATPHPDGSRRIRLSATAPQQRQEAATLRQIAHRLRATTPSRSPTEQRAAARAADTVIRQLTQLTSPPSAPKE